MYAPQNGPDLSMVMHEMWDVQMGENINSIGISRLKILNILASSTKSDYQKIYFGYLVLKKLGVFLELIKTKCFLQPTTYEMREL